MKPSNWFRPFRCHVDACQNAVGDTVTQVGHDDLEYVIAYISKPLVPAEENYSANECKLFGVIYSFKRFRCYSERTELEVLTDIQGFTKQFYQAFSQLT